MSEFSAPGALAPVISDTWDAPRPWTLAAFIYNGPAWPGRINRALATIQRPR